MSTTHAPMVRQNAHTHGVGNQIGQSINAGEGHVGGLILFLQLIGRLTIFQNKKVVY